MVSSLLLKDTLAFSPWNVLENHPHNALSSPEASWLLPDEVKLVVPGVHVEHRPHSDHVVVAAAHALHVLVLEGHLGEQLEVLRGPAQHLLGRVEPVHQQRPPARALVLQAVEHLDAARRQNPRGTTMAACPWAEGAPQGHGQVWMDAPPAPAASLDPIPHVLLGEEAANCLCCFPNPVTRVWETSGAAG